jgi:hypothetical protein
VRCGGLGARERSRVSEPIVLNAERWREGRAKGRFNNLSFHKRIRGVYGWNTGACSSSMTDSSKELIVFTGGRMALHPTNEVPMRIVATPEFCNFCKEAL